MENILSEFKAENLEIKLTSDKLFINTDTSNETFALRSINGIGVVDLIEDYNQALIDWNGKKNSYIVFYIFGSIFAIWSLFTFGLSTIFSICIMLVSAFFFRAGYVLHLNKDKNVPKLFSVVRIMMNGGNRDFKFDKSGTSGESVAEFVVKVESTLTAYNKNNMQ